MMKRRTAFTLVELLVVIGIIALLIAILLPTLNGARRSSRQLKCLSNIRLLGQVDQMYQTEWKGWHLPAYYGWSQATGGWNPSTPPAIPADGPRRYWFQTDMLLSVLGAINPSSGRYPPATACPESPNSEARANVNGITLHNSYAMNYTSLPGMNVTLATQYFNAWKNSQVLAAAEKIQFCDASSEGVGVSNALKNATLRYNDPYYGEAHEPPDKGGAVSYRHKKGANVLFYDGHAEWKNEKDLIVDPGDPGSIKNLRQWQPKIK